MHKEALEQYWIAGRVDALRSLGLGVNKTAEEEEEDSALGDLVRDKLQSQFLGKRLQGSMLGGLGIGTAAGAGAGALAGHFGGKPGGPLAGMSSGEGALLGGMTGMAVGPLGGLIYGYLKHKEKAKQEASEAWKEMQSGKTKGLSMNVLSSPYYY